ncbi:MAG: hypothetical protein HKP58_17840 [Desulfatitalea sp.]|nr:hypothetical protein [Desulfatitalea sp.]NNK02278.1 hypothetical protein [Desulfatitalea sp.]
MSKKNGVMLLFLFIPLLATYFLSQRQVAAFRADYSYRLHANMSRLPDIVVEILAGEFKGLVADYLLLDAAAFIGSSQSLETSSDEDWNAVARLLEQSSRLDPCFRNTYILTQGALPWRAHKYHETIKILARSKQHLSWDWIPGFFIGFDSYFFLKDNLTASQELMEASKIEGAPFTLATLASRLASQAGRTRAAIEFLSAVYENTEDQDAKNVIQVRIQALQGVQALQIAVGTFQIQFGRKPDTLDELVEKGVLPHLPVNPYNKPYSYVDGKIDF